MRYVFDKALGAWWRSPGATTSGLVAGSVPDFAMALSLTADQQTAIGVFCAGTAATLSSPITSCSDPNHGAKRLNIPADGTGDDLNNPPRSAPRHQFDLGVGVTF